MGDALKWYRAQTVKEDWEDLKDRFVKRFPVRQPNAVRDIGPQVRTFARREGESLVEYVKRANGLRTRRRWRRKGQVWSTKCV